MLLLCFSLILAAETAYFGGRCLAGLLRQRGERAFFRSDHRRAWRNYEGAMAWGGDAGTLAADEVELLLFGLDQREAGFRIRTEFPVGESLARARDLAVRLIREAPYKAYYWSLVADIYHHEARRRRLETPIDLDTLSEDPLANLLPEDWLSIAALETATQLEPNNYVYPDLLVEMLLEIDSPDLAAHYCRLAVAANPNLRDHRYLLRADLQPVIVEAALLGFADARGAHSMLPPDGIDTDAGRLLVVHGQDERAIPYLERAAALVPKSYDALSELGSAYYRMKDYEGMLRSLERARLVHPDQPWPYYGLGLAHLALGDLQAAMSDFTAAREADPRDLRYFHALGETLEKAGRIEEAERQFLAAANLNQGEGLAWSALLAFYVRHPDRKGAAEACANLLTLGQVDSAVREQCAALEREAP